MAKQQQSPVICLMGPTASGKTHLAIELVQRLPLEIISVDSALVYQGMDIGTAKPTAAERAAAPHRLLDICDPADSYSAGQFVTDAKQAIAEIMQAGKIPLLVGGTMLYFNALQQGLADLPGADLAIRQQVAAKAKASGWPALHQTLSTIDPAYAAQIHQNDSQRISRALEIYYATGKTLSAYHQAQSEQVPAYDFINIIIAPKDRSILHQRIEQRFHQMLAAGFIEEVQQLYARPDLHKDLPAIRTVGYRQVWQYLAGEYDQATMIHKAIVATRQFAKRQYTWLRRFADAQRFDSEDAQLVEQVFNWLTAQESLHAINR